MAPQKRTRRKQQASRPKGNSVSLRVAAIPIGPEKRADVSHQLEKQDEIWQIDTDGGEFVIKPPYTLKNLASALEISNVLRQCIQAYVVNIASFGYRVVARYEDQEADEGEKKKLQSFIEFANPRESLSAVVKKALHDYEHYGFSFYEIIRNKKRSPTLIRHLPAANTRLMKTKGPSIETKVEINRGGSTRATVTERRKFRRYVQQIGSSKTYFKEFGDPRRMSYKTGKYETEGAPVSEDDLATEAIHERQYSEDSYGIPRWISQLPNIIGSREAEESNMRFFEDNTVPPALLTVSGGRLTRESFAQLKNILESEGLGKHRQHKILLIEAVPETAGLDEKGMVKVQLDPLTNARQSDGLFKEYDEGNQAKIRSSFRLPPALIGLSQDVTFATANTSVFIAETQVFLPERKAHDEVLNNQLVHGQFGLNMKTVKLESRGPTITNPDQLVKSLTALNVMGGLTPRRAVAAINEVLDWTIDQYPEKGDENYEKWMDTPMQIAVKTARSGENGEETQGESAVKDGEIDDVEDGETGPRNPENGDE